jgi:acetyl-CoA synthetase
VLITDSAGLPKVAPFRDRLPDLSLVLSIDGEGEGAVDFHAELSRASERFDPVATLADDPALISYTSGTTGPPKGAVHAHRSLLGHLPGVELPQDFFPQPGDCFWTPADWAWIGGLMDVLLPAWHHGVPVVAYRAAKFDPEDAFRLIAELGVRNIFLPPTALKLMRQVPGSSSRHALSVRSIGSGGEPLGPELLAWGRERFGLTINEFYGQTECNLVLGNCATLMPVRPGSMGRPIPGHDVALIDADGHELPDGTLGEVAIRRPDPVMFLGYWRRPDDTAAKFVGDWLATGDLARRDDEGYFWFAGRKDDVITSAGYRIGPGEIEDCLLRHPAVALAAVIGVPDAERTERIKAFVVVRDDVVPGAGLADEIRAFVRDRLAAHEYPRDVEFVAELPLTTTGKIMRRVLRDREQLRTLTKETGP